MVLVTISIMGCSKEPQIEVLYVDRVVEKLVPTPCEIPVVKCYVDMNSSYTIKLDSVAKCINNLNNATKVYR